jgi:DNA-binding MarR family transcriptional regulator
MDLHSAPLAPGPTSTRLQAPAGDADLVLEVADLLGRTVRRLHRGTSEALAPLGLSRAQARLVRLLADGPLRMAVIAERLAVVPRTITDIVDCVETAGFVVRRPDPDDRRATLVALTPDGRRLLDRLDAVRRESAGQVLGRLDPPDLARLHAVLLELTADAPDACRPCPGGHGGAPVVAEGAAR